VALDQQNDNNNSHLYGAVSTGNIWQFGILDSNNKQITQDLNLFRVTADLENLLLRVAPKVIIEIDTKVDTQNDAMNYFYIKTEKLLNFGVEKVIWITSKSKKVMIATNNDKEWKILNWQEKIEIIDGISLSITDLLKQRHFIID
jgi:hypothetical protein